MTRPPLSRLHRSTSWLAIGLLMPWPALAQDQAVSDVPLAVTAITREEIGGLPRGTDLLAILDLHNQVRADVGSPPLRWNPGNAQRAQAVADILAETGNLQHSSRVGRENERENIVVGSRSGIAPLAMAQTWVDERPLFRGGIFPDACTGDWSACAHYTQMVWTTTTDVGCGFAVDDFVALVCRYSPPGNRDGRFVIDLTAAPPIIAINNTPDPVANCQVPEPEEWVKLLHQSEFGLAGSDPRDAPTDRQWALALEREQDVQDRLMTELATVQGNVATHMNAYLAATSAWQGDYTYLASTTTGLQGLLTNWLEAREILENADLAFAVANLGVGGVKLGFKAYKFMTAPKAAAAGAEAVAGATRVAGAADEAAAAGATRVAGAADEGVAAAGDTQIFNRTIIPPGQNPNVRGFRNATGATSTAGSAADVARGNWQSEVDMMRRLVTEAEQAGDTFLAQVNREALEGLLRTGPQAPIAPVSQAVTAAQRVADLDPGLVSAAREAGVNVDNIAAGAGNLEAQNVALMRAIAEARGWHDIPAWAGDPIANVLIQARKTLAGAGDAPVSPQQLEIVKSLKTYVESRGLNFADWLRTAAGETSDKVGTLGTTENVADIVKYFDDADIDLLLKVLDTGGDTAALRNAVSPVAQAWLNGLGRAAQAGVAGCGGLDTGLALNGVGGTTRGASGAGAPPTDAQLGNVLDMTGKLGEVGLGNIVDQFGVTDRFTAGQGLPRAMVGELWDFISSPSATVGSYYFTFQAQDEYLALLQNEQDKLIQLGTHLTAASNALGALQGALQRAGLSGSGSYLGTQGPAALQGALDGLQGVYDSGSPEWQQGHKDDLDGRRDHINQKLAALAETVADLNTLASRMAQMRNWLDSLRLDPTGGLRGPVELFNPLVFIRLGSISLYLRGMAADSFGLTTEVPFRITVPPSPPPPPQSASAPAEDFDAMRARLEARSRAIDEAPEAEVDPSLEEWLDQHGGSGD